MSTKNIDRRDFLKGIGIVGGSSLLFATFPWLQSCTPAAQKLIEGKRAKIAVIGTGSRGMYHLNNFLKTANAEIVALCDIYQPHLDEAAKLFPKAKKSTNYHEILESENVQAIFIACPLHLHSRITIDGLKAGKHVFCEKAMARTIDECMMMVDAWKASQKVLFIGQQRLFDIKYIKAMEMIHNGKVGEIVGVRNTWFRNNDWRRPIPKPDMERFVNWRLYKEYSGGLMTELACHQISNGTWALKGLPDYIMGSGDIVFWKDGREVYDSVSLVYHFPNGVKMTFESNTANKRYGMEEQILGKKGTIELSHGKFYPETLPVAPGIRQFVNQIEHGVFGNAVFAGTSWVPETASDTKGENIMQHVGQSNGESSVGASDDGSEALIAAFCHSVITGQQCQNLVEEAYYSSVLSLLGLQAMDEKKVITFPKEYKIPYLNFA